MTILFAKTSGFGEGGAAELRASAAAIFGQIFDKLAHAVDMERIVNKASMPRLRHKPGAI
jgi:hypothetical protein